MITDSSHDACGTPEPGQPIGGGSGSEPGSISDLIKQAVDQGYQVIDQYIAEGRNAASLIRDGSYNQEQAELDIRNLLNHWVVLAKQLSVTGIELVSAIVSDSRLVPPPKSPSKPKQASSNFGAARQDAARQVAIETRSKKPVQVHFQLDPAASLFQPSICDLYAADRTLPPLTGMKFVVADGKRPVLVIEVPDQQPAGTYTGAIVDASNNEGRGTVSVTVL